jgi:hypothetical protein
MMNTTTKREIIKTLIEARRIDLANATAEQLRSTPVATYTAEEVTAASLSRIWQHFTTDDVDTGVVIVSADRGDRVFREQGGKLVKDKAANEKANAKLREKLKQILRTVGKGGYIQTKGGYKEEGVGLVYEYSFVVPGVTRDEAVKLARRLGQGAEINGLPPEQKVKKSATSLEQDFRQDSILWGNNEAGAWLLYADGTAEKVGTAMKANNVQNYFTEWRKRRVAFGSVCASIEYIPDSPSDYRQWRRHLASHANR